MAKLTKEMKQDYEEFLVEIPMLLEDLQELLQQSKSCKSLKLDYDNDTLEKVERFYLDVLEGKEKITVSQARMNRIFIAYVGDAVISRAESGHAKWALNPIASDPSFGTPVIIDWAKGDEMAISPVELRELLIKNRQPFLRELVEYCETKSGFEEDFFKEFR